MHIKFTWNCRNRELPNLHKINNLVSPDGSFIGHKLRMNLPLKETIWTVRMPHVRFIRRGGGQRYKDPLKQFHRVDDFNHFIAKLLCGV